jgi:hypothetical protein
MIPVDSAYEKQWKEAHPDKPVPQYMQLESSETGKPITKRAAFDIQVSIGEGLPTNKLALLNVILSLSKMVLPDELTGQPRSLLSYQQVQRMIEDILGIPIIKILPEAERMMGAVMGANGGTANQNVTLNNPEATAQNPYIDGAGGQTGLMSNQPMGATA